MAWARGSARLRGKGGIFGKAQPDPRAGESWYGQDQGHQREVMSSSETEAVYYYSGLRYYCSAKE